VGYAALVRAEILTIGDELCRGEIVDTNSSYLAARLWDLDVVVGWMTSCRDDAGDLRRAVSDAVGRCDLVVTSGGLGPTEDDLTVDVLAELAGAAVVVDEPARARMAARFGDRVAITPTMLRQVRVPAGARVHGNPAGLAPCFELAIAGVPVVCLPGVPRELHAIVDGGLADRIAELREARGDVTRIARRIYRVFGLGESQVSAACAGLVDGVDGASIHYQVKFPEVLLKLVVRDRDRGAADGRLAALDAAVRARITAERLYATGETALPELVCAELRAAGLTVATAESCTGGMIGELLTRPGGASAYFAGGAICYSNAEKVRQLGVAADVIERHGAVSEEVVRQMAEGARERFGVDLAVAVSGVAGPDGGTADKPVGTVWLALAENGGATTTHRLGWPGPRDMVRTLAAWWALAMIRAALARRRGA
jgi:nicotinamide-nucleotide amidase